MNTRYTRPHETPQGMIKVTVLFPDDQYTLFSGFAHPSCIPSVGEMIRYSYPDGGCLDHGRVIAVHNVFYDPEVNSSEGEACKVIYVERHYDEDGYRENEKKLNDSDDGFIHCALTERRLYEKPEEK